jgi:hypothetical protein
MQRKSRCKEDVVLGMPEIVTIVLAVSVGAIALFSFLAVAAWAASRRREREAYYRSEVVKKLSGMPGDAAVALLREQERNAMRRQREGLRLSGLVTAAVGIGLMIFLRALMPGAPIYLVSLIPLLIGAAFLLYSYILAPKD